MKPEDLSNLSEVALQYGPFFFSLLFVLVVSRWAYGAFKETNAGKNSTPQALSTVRLVFLCSFFFGLVLVAVSVNWWLRSRPHLFEFRGEIVDLHDYEKLASASENLYFRREIRDSIDGIPMRNEHFLITQSTAFHKGDVFDIEFSKNNSPRNEFKIFYDGVDSYPKFRVTWDDSLHTNVLQPEKQHSAQAIRFGRTVYAAPAQTMVYQGKSTRRQVAQQADSPIAVLQDPSSDVGSKIVALDELNRVPPSVLTERSLPGHEPVLATLLDLTRYSDKEVSYKATAVIKRVDLDDYLLGKLNSRDKRDQADGEKVLLKLSATDSTRILGKLSPAKASPLRARISRSAVFQVAPTASPQGDRYYVKARWNPGDERVVSCLTTLFNKELINTRSLDQERALMKGRSERLVFGYDKDWSTDMAEKIRTCGGESSFVVAGMAK
jgi:hypothetical protein